MQKSDQQSVLFEGLADKPVVVRFERPDESSDGGLLLLQAADQRLGLLDQMAAAVRDARQHGKVDHELVELFRERVFAIACGYPDCNDAARLRGDPMMKLACGRSPISGDALASQPTLSRFENSMSRTDLLRVAYAQTRVVIGRLSRRKEARRAKTIVIDMDPTEDPTYGNQQLTFFNAYYDNWCYLPMMTTIRFDDRGEQWMVAPVLRPGNAKGSAGAITILKRLLPLLKSEFPRARRFRVRLDGAFAAPEVLDWLERQPGVDYLVNLPKNAVLKRMAEPLMREVRKRSEISGRTEKAYGEIEYKADKWKKARRVIVKAEVVRLEGREPRDNPRFVVTGMDWSPKNIYAAYAARGEVENRFKELHYDLRFDLTSCTAFNANQLRNLLTTAAYALYQLTRQAVADTECAAAQVGTMRDRLIKIGVRVIESVRRIVLQAPASFPWLSAWRRAALALSAPGG